MELEKSDSHLAGISQRRESLSERKRMEHCAWRLVDILAPADRVRELAAEFTETCVYDSLEQLCEYSEIIFLTVPDGQIGEVWKSIKDLDIRGRIICHASGAMTSRYFLRYNRGGSLWLFGSSYVCNKFKVRIL